MIIFQQLVQSLPQEDEDVTTVLRGFNLAYPVPADFPEQVTEEGLFAEFQFRAEPAILSLSPGGFEWINRTVTYEEPKPANCCLGLCNKDEVLHKLCVHSFECNKRRSAMWKPIKYVFLSINKLQIVQWSQKANEFISQLIHRPKELWVFVNPYGGTRQTPRIWRKQVKPLFELAGIQSRVVITKEANEAYEMMKTASKQSLESIDGVVAVGGDGLFQEIMNGLLERFQKPWCEKEANDRSLRLGHIPAGSTDAVAWSVNGSRCPLSSALRIIFGDRISLDVMKIESEENHQSSKYSACLAGYGFMGDVISISEKLRCFGSMRYDIAGMMAFFSCNTHEAKISYMKSTKNNTVDDLWQNSSNEYGAMRNRFESEVSTIPSTAVETVEDEFISIMITVNPCRSDKSPNGLIPHAHLSDGRLHITLVQKCSRLQYLSFLLSVAKHGVRPGQYSFVRSIDAEWVKVEPLNSKSSWNVDGEVIRHKGLASMVHNGLVQVFARGIEQ
eukprot:g6572.t1